MRALIPLLVLSVLVGLVVFTISRRQTVQAVRRRDLTAMRSTLLDLEQIVSDRLVIEPYDPVANAVQTRLREHRRAVQ